MDAHDELAVSAGTTHAPDLEAVRRAYELIHRAGVVAGVEELLKVCHEDVEMHAYAAHTASSISGGDDVLRGHDEVIGFFRRAEEAGFEIALRTKGFESAGDSVLVRGSIRVTRPDGSFAETSVRWTYRFRDGLVEQISWEPRAGD
jgi:ketosteroid isomerase-like protein